MGILKEIFLELDGTEEIGTSTDQSSGATGAETEKGENLTPQDLAAMEDLKNDFSQALDDEIPVVAEERIYEKMSLGGFEYESTVLNSIKKAGLTGNITQGAGSDKNSADADIKIGGRVYPVEVKMNKNAQMGGSSLKFTNGKVSFTKPIDPEVDALLLGAIKQKGAEIKNMVAFLNKNRPRGINSRVTGFPLVCTRNAWEAAAKKKLLVNAYVQYSTDFIAKHYNSKGIYYIQIGGAGLFYLGSNPANLPIPPLSGDIVIEVRSARSGSKPLSDGTLVVAGGIRVQGRLKTKGTSPYSLDNTNSILQMLATMKSPRKAKPSK